MLAVAYVLRLDDLARDVHAHTVGAAVAQALGGRQVGGDRADWETAKALFDAELAADPGGRGDPGDDSPRAIKLRALGVA
ncbi:hypothetical protein [Micromonospora aurantiaca (nom. illeg.)]|uniref:hypothetical protein n=1 Tax=Micromonospora aurantiaca (nom. illeg.) TaxID=47850 RepID=UPI003F4A0A29